MDQNRQIRFLIPPFVVFFSLLLGFRLDECNDFLGYFNSTSIQNLIGLASLVTATIIPLGYILSSVSIFLLRIITALYGKVTYEAVLSNDTQKRVWKLLKVDPNFDFNPDLILSTAAAFDHELFSKNIHEWIQRRWSSFNISCNSVISLIIAYFLAPLFNIHHTYSWAICTVLFLLVFSFNAIYSWRETMKMFEFQSYREHKIQIENIEKDLNKSEE